MKNIFKVSLGILLALALLCTSAFALSSPTDAVEVTGDDVKVANVEEGIPELIVEPPWILIWMGDVTANGAITFNVRGYEGPVRVYHFTDDAWKIEAEAENPVTVNPETNSPFAVAIKRAEGDGQTDEPVDTDVPTETTSPKTGETVLPYAAIGVAMVAAAAAVVIRRKED
ncbi:MAG: LPXTG cell wall anchor domain-containing protein [Oscillospiraceae bacterium]|nr:LPXTG cell wall anchor domain-containing protein [Oscillospiraceae bacterium]